MVSEPIVPELMVYECETCEAVLGPGLTVCPRCGQVFDEPVPADALWDDVVAVVSEERAAPPLLEEALPEAAAPPRPRSRRRWPRAAAAVLVLLVGVWLGYHSWDRAAPPKPVSVPIPRPPTDLEAHPQYAARMTALLEELRATGVGAEWPAFGSNDTLVVTPQARPAEPSVTWDTDSYRRLAQGIYGHFAMTRFEAGFPEPDTQACFVIVTSASGEVVAVDFMGDLK